MASQAFYGDHGNSKHIQTIFHFRRPKVQISFQGAASFMLVLLCAASRACSRGRLVGNHAGVVHWFLRSSLRQWQLRTAPIPMPWPPKRRVAFQMTTSLPWRPQAEGENMTRQGRIWMADWELHNQQIRMIRSFQVAKKPLPSFT